MARSFSSRDTNILLNRHKRLLNELHASKSLTSTYYDDIRAAADEMALYETLAILADVPVEELTKHKKGLKTKPLRDAGVMSIADVYRMSADRIAYIRGISEDTAYTIKAIAGHILMSTRKEVKLRLSTDQKDKYSTALIRAVYRLKSSIAHIDICKNLLSENEAEINRLCEQVKPGKNVLRWLFASKNKKSDAELAYKRLSDILNGEYGIAANSAIKMLKDICEQNDAVAWADFSLQSATYFPIIERICPGMLGGADDIYGLPKDLANALAALPLNLIGLKCVLRRYQEWGVKFIIKQKRVLLGDEMGLGKTVQAIAAMVALRNQGATHFVVVCPASVLINWCREIEKHSNLRVIMVHGQYRNAALAEWKETGGVAVTTYDTTGRFVLNPEFKYSLTVVDEAHYIKNPMARRTYNTIALCSHSDRLLFMTGTALENKVSEMIGLIDYLQPNVAKSVGAIAYMPFAPQFRKKIAPVYFRRKREDVLVELPKLIESEEWCELSSEEERAYESSLLCGNYMSARRVSWNIDDLSHSSKAARLSEIVEEARTEERKVIVFSYFLDTLSKIGAYLGDKCVGKITGAVTPAMRLQTIDAFDSSPAGSVLLAQILSGGTGLNIQSASVVIICEPQFKPSIENQAISRAYRMGQVRNVLVYRLLSPETIDERIVEILKYKQQIFDAFADKSEAARESIELDKKAFGELIKAEVERVGAKLGASGAVSQQAVDDAFSE